MAEVRHSYFAVVRNNVTPKLRRDTILKMAVEQGVIDDAIWLE
jgi:hypothetical protein